MAEVLIPHLWEALTINRIAHLEHLGEQRISRRFELAICDRNGTLHHDEAAFRALMRAEFGAGFLGKLPDECIRTLLAVGRYRGDAIVISVARPVEVLFLKARLLCNVDRLSPRELQIATEVARGRSHKSVAEALGIAPSTVRNHVQAIHDKLGVRNAAELAAEVSRIS